VELPAFIIPPAVAIAKMLNKKRRRYGIRCATESTDGSVFNVNAVMSGQMEFGIVQSDRQYQAVNGLAEWRGRPQKYLRAVFCIYPESVTLVAAADSGIRRVNGLKGKRVNIGSPDSGQRQNALDVLAAMGIGKKDIKVEGVRAAEAPALLQKGRIDAFFYTVGHPNAAFREATAGVRKVHIVPISGPDIANLIRKKPYYAKSVVPVKKFYPAATNGEDTIETFDVKATLVTSAKVPDDVVYAITKEIFDNFETFKTLHPAYEVLDKKKMLEDLSAQIHPGAMRYYKEAGLIK